MQFGLLNEKQIIEAAGGLLDKLVMIWHHDIAARYNSDIEIVLGNRRDSQSPLRGGVLTDTAISIIDGQVRLIIWYDPLELYYEARIAELGYSSSVIDEMTAMLSKDRDPGAEYDPVANPEKLDYINIGAQIGRWLMKFRGYKRLSNEDKNFHELETFLNLECGAPVLYSVLDEAGLDWSTLERKRLEEVYEGLRNMEEPAKRIDRTLNALRISNIFEFSPDCDLKDGLEELLSSRFPRILETAEGLGQMKKDYNLLDPDGLNRFMRDLVLKYRMPGSWITLDETKGIF